MRRASRDYSKYLRGAEEPGAGAECGSTPPPSSQPAGGASAPSGSPSASRALLAALVLLGLGQVICSLALFLYFKAQADQFYISIRKFGLPKAIGRNGFQGSRQR
ncbi:hypothetical protein Chor_004539 [Crotalus horridus]